MSVTPATVIAAAVEPSGVPSARSNITPSTNPISAPRSLPPATPAAADPVDRESSRADVAILCYPVISFGEFAHAGSRKNLLGEKPEPALVDFLSAELQVTAQTTPSFIWHTVEDKAVPVENAHLFASALRRAGVPYSLHIYEKGAHGLGLGRPGKPAPPWADQCLYWLRERKFLLN
jgi:acetyl esterase/lipase